MEPKNCWEYWDCHEEIRDRCPAYTTPYSGQDCFYYAKDFCPKIKKDEFEHCWECPWYKKIKPDSDKAGKI